MVPVFGLGQAEKPLQQNVDLRRLEEILAANHAGDALVEIVEHDGEMVGRAHVGPRHGDVADAGFHLLGRDAAGLAIGAAAGLDEGEGVLKGGERALHVEAQRQVGQRSRRRFGRAADPGIDQTVRAEQRRALLRRRRRRADVRARARARIEQAAPPQIVERAAVAVAAPGLAHHRLGPAQAEPAEAVEDLLLPFGPVASLIEIVDAQQERAALAARRVVREQRGMGVAEMQRPGRRGRESGDEAHCAAASAGAPALGRAATGPGRCDSASHADQASLARSV